MEIVKLDPKQFGIEESKATVIEQSFLPKVVERDGLISVYENLLTKEIDKTVCEEAATLRKKLVKVRTGIDAIHKTEKAFYLASGRYVDALKNKHTLPIEQMEEKLSEIEKYYENIEKQRISDLQAARELELQPYEVENVQQLALGVMAESVWTAFLSGTKTAYENKKEQERLAEEARQAEIAAEKERIEAQRIENERLRQEAAEVSRLRAEEQAKADAERKAANEMLRIEKEKAEAILKQEREEAARLAKIEADKQAAIQAKAAAELKAANEAAAKIAAELKAKQDAEAKAETDRIAAEKKAAKAPVKEKLKVAVSALLLELPESEITADITAKFNGFKQWALTQIESL